MGLVRALFLVLTSTDLTKPSRLVCIFTTLAASPDDNRIHLPQGSDLQLVGFFVLQPTSVVFAKLVGTRQCTFPTKDQLAPGAGNLLVDSKITDSECT